MTSSRFTDKAVTRILRLPPPTTRYTVHRGVRVPMRDGVELLADHYRPDTPLGTILVRGPYGRAFPFSVIYARIYAARGYHVVFQSVRGTSGSGGEFSPMVHEAADGADTAAWLREQPWFTGSFATLGLSYLGFTQWALMEDPPPELAAAIVAVGPHDVHTSSWGTGAFALSDFLGWADMMAHQEQGLLKRLSYQVNVTRRLAASSRELPLGTAGRALLGGRSSWYQRWLAHPDGSDPFWDPMRMTAALARSSVPVLLISGWQDVFLDQTLTQYAHLRSRDVEVAMTIGPWTHDQMVTRAGTITAVETLSWLGRHLSGRPAQRSEPVRIDLGGRWVDLPDWPPQTRAEVLHLAPGGRLEPGPPAGDATVSFRYDPADPTPTVGGRLLSRQAGYRDDSALACRPDVLSFTGEALTTDLCLCGTPEVELDYRCDTPYFDVFVRVSEVGDDGRSHNVSDGYRRFSGTTAGPLRISLDACAHRLRAGSRVRLLVGGGCHPRFDRNLGIGEPVITGLDMTSSTHTVRFGADSRLMLPVIEC